MHIVFFLALFALIYLLYINGYIGVQSTRALLYIGSLGNIYKSRHKSKMVACSGYIKKVLKLKEDREYRFVLDLKISKGDIAVDILDSEKNTILTLNNDNKEGRIRVTQNSRYYLVLRFYKVNGTYELIWE